jgi:hypothetical protein
MSRDINNEFGTQLGLDVLTFRQRLSKPLVLGVILLCLSLFFAGVISFYGTSAFYILLIGLFVAPIAYAIIAYPKAGILILLTLAYIIMFFSKFTSGFPIGTVMDGVEFLLILGFFLKQKREQNWSIFKTSTTAVILVWVAYNLMQAVNPAASSIFSWVYTVRTIAGVTVTYFIFLYHIRDVKFIRMIIKLWIFLSFIGALYGFKQEYFGFAGFEQAWLDSDPSYTYLYFIGNHWRKFSIFTDPVTFAYNMVISGLLCISLMTGPIKRSKKIILGCLSAFFFITMLYSGTRGAYVLIPCALLLFGILKYNRKVLIIGVAVSIIMTVLIFIPTSNYNLYRFQTAFKPANDASFNVRKANQKRIQPFIQSHPFGGGLGSTGIWGQRFSPGSYLANFPPDSGYVRVAVELGWVGLFIFCTFMFVVLKSGIKNYFSIKDPELKTYCFGMLLILFALNLGNYPQEGLVQYPINIYFYLAIALMQVTLRLDKEKQKLQAVEDNS